jgi:ribosomal protein S18 acetylase RimI-like enzyme
MAAWVSLYAKDRSMKKATPDKYAAVVDITARAFDDDPALAWMFRKDSKRSAAVRLFMQTLGRMIYFPRGEAYINDTESGATMWLPLGVNGDIGFFEQLLSVPAMIRISGITGIPNLLRVQTLLEKKHPDKPHYYLFSVAALPEKRGQGIGSGMMEPMT